MAELLPLIISKIFNFFFFVQQQILFYLPTCFFLWTMKPSKGESTLYGKIFLQGGGGGGGEGVSTLYGKIFSKGGGGGGGN